MSTHEPQKETGALAKIRAGEVRMRPRIFFVIRAVVTVVSAALILILSSGIASFVLFSLQETGHTFLLGFGARGILAFLFLFPWLLLSIDIALLILLDWLLRGFAFGYRFSVLSLFGCVFLVSLFIALGINATPLHHTLEQYADRGELPVAGGFYEDVRRSHHELGLYRGIISDVSTSSFVMTHDDRDVDTDDASYTVFVSHDSPPLFAPGDHVFVLGDLISSSSVRAVHIQVFPKAP